jgi:transcription elongation GreA/GreB family factor
MNETLRTDPEISKARAIRIGSVVMLHFIDDPDEPVETFTMISGKDSQSGKYRIGVDAITNVSPIGVAIYGAKAGDIKEFQVGSMGINRVRIMSVEQPE